jgi:GGDEF domain-containing protein
VSIVLERRRTASPTVAAAIVLGLEPLDRDLVLDDREAAIERLERSVRPWDVVVPLGVSSVAVLCTALTSAREVDAVASRLADVVRAPMAVGDEIHQVGVCLGAAVIDPAEERKEAFARAREAMLRMRATRAALLKGALPEQRQGEEPAAE